MGTIAGIDIPKISMPDFSPGTKELQTAGGVGAGVGLATTLGMISVEARGSKMSMLGTAIAVSAATAGATAFLSNGEPNFAAAGVGIGAGIIAGGAIGAAMGRGLGNGMRLAVVPSLIVGAATTAATLIQQD